MRVLVIGATGTIGKEIVRALDGHDVVTASRHDAAHPADITDAASLRALFASAGQTDAVISAAGGGRFKPLAALTEEDFAATLDDKLMGQVNVVRLALASGNVRDGGSITITSGVLAQQPMQGSAAISLVNAALEGFARAAALEAPRGIRVNVVSPGWVSETLAAMGQDPSGGVPAATVARAYVSSVEGTETGAVLSV